MKTIFWNVDTQYDFMRKDGKLYVQDAEKIEENLSKITRLASQYNIKVVNTGDWHNKHSRELSTNPNFIDTFPEHCMQNTKGAEFIHSTNPNNPYIIDWNQKGFDKDQVSNRRNIVIYKDEFDVFTGTPHIDKVLQLINPDTVIVYGVATNVCVDYAVNGLIDRDIKVFVIEDAIKELPQLSLKKTLDNWKNKGVVLTKIDNLENLLGGIL